jgi:hypothetical protein
MSARIDIRVRDAANLAAKDKVVDTKDLQRIRDAAGFSLDETEAAAAAQFLKAAQTKGVVIAPEVRTSLALWGRQATTDRMVNAVTMRAVGEQGARQAVLGSALAGRLACGIIGTCVGFVAGYIGAVCYGFVDNPRD